MVNYYDILKVSHDASSAEIKSAYRRLARKLHPDKNDGSEETALRFAAIAEAYEVLGNQRERHRYDKRLSEISANGSGDSVFTSTNSHAKRWRQMVYEKRYNDIIDRMIAEERREAMAFQKVVYPLVALFISAIFVTAFKPKIFVAEQTGNISRIIIVALFLAGVILLVRRIRDGFSRFTENLDNIHESILDDGERKSKPFQSVTVAAMLIGGVVLCLSIGYLIGSYTDFAANIQPNMFSRTFEPEFFLYPPIVTFFVDLMHSFASGLDR
ncbi:MAG: J domain-containing protein [Pyrinomonadaceae bacterium]